MRFMTDSGLTANETFYAGRLPSTPSIAERDEQKSNSDMHPVDFGTSVRREAVGTYLSLPSGECSVHHLRVLVVTPVQQCQANLCLVSLWRQT
jgi:hypothetical protein